MTAAPATATLEQFRATYAEVKPYYELLDGEAFQKDSPTEVHSFLQGVLFLMLKEFGFRSMFELTLAISETWEPTPDVCGRLGPRDGMPYPTKPVAVVVEILSPKDPFTRVIQKCRKYSDWGIPDILVFDPVGREAWHWDTAADDLTRFKQSYSFKSKPGAHLELADVFQRLDAEL